MAAHSPRPAEPRAVFVVRYCALLGLFVALLTLAISLQGGGTDVAGAAVITAFLTGPFLLALISLRWQNSAAAQVTWLLCGLVALGVGGMLLASGVGVFLAAAGAGLIAAWWLSR